VQAHLANSPAAVFFDRWYMQVWRTVLNIAFLLFCIRFQIAAIRSVGPDFASVIVLIVGALILSFWNRWAAIFAFTAGIPLFNGIGQDGFLPCTTVPTLLFTAIWMGICAKDFLQILLPDQRHSKLEPATNSNPYAPSLKKSKIAKYLNMIRYFGGGTSSEISFSRLVTLFTVDLLITAALVSFIHQIFRLRGSEHFWGKIFSQTDFSYNDSLYSLTAAFVWLQGFFYFKMLYIRHSNSSTSNYQQGSAMVALQKWSNPIFIMTGIWLAIFFLIELIFHIPEGWIGASTQNVWIAAGFQAPYEDISSFGSIAVALLIFSVATLGSFPWLRLGVHLIACICMLVMVIASWSRATWLAGSIFLLLIVAWRLPRSWILGFTTFLILSVVYVNANANRPVWITQPYLSRLAALVRFENPTNKSVARINLYKKAAGMVREHAIVGHGIGSFYVSSVYYASPEDPLGKRPDFAHNAILQMAAEEGVPVAVIFTGLTGWIIVWGLYLGLIARPLEPFSKNEKRCIAGATLALGCYFETQMSANSLNVYSSNQYFFWFLAAVILSSLEIANRQEKLLRPSH